MEKCSLCYSITKNIPFTKNFMFNRLMFSFFSLYIHGGNSKDTTCVVDRDVSAYKVVDRVLRLSAE